METEFMKLGALRAATVQPPLSANFWHPPLTTPQFPQYTLRQTYIGALRPRRRVAVNGLKATGNLLYGLGQAAGPPSGLEARLEAAASDARVDLGAAVGYAMLSLLSAGASAYHGFRRDRKPMSAVGWGFMGALFPIVTPIVAVVQGYAKPKGR